MIDPVVAVVAAPTLAMLVVFGPLASAAMHDRLGGGFTGRVRAKLLAGLVCLLAAGLAGVLGHVPLAGWGVGLTSPGKALAWTGGCLVVLVPVIYFAARRESAWEFAPEVRADRYGRREILALLAAWSVYLFGYELLFRGLVTFQLVEAFGTVRGLAVMTGLYVLAHLTKRPSEAFSTLVAGPLYGWIALESGGFWPVFVVHVVMGMTSELGSAVANPDIEVDLS